MFSRLIHNRGGVFPLLPCLAGIALKSRKLLLVNGSGLSFRIRAEDYPKGRDEETAVSGKGVFQGQIPDEYIKRNRCRGRLRYGLQSSG